MGVFGVREARARLLGLAVARLGLVVNLGWNGLAKFTAEEAHGIAPLVGGSPLFAWPLRVFGLRGLSGAIGVVELATAALLIVGLWSWRANTVAVVLCVATFATTLSFFGTSVRRSAVGLNPPDGFLLKDIVLLGASIALWRSKPAPPKAVVADEGLEL